MAVHLPRSSGPPFGASPLGAQEPVLRSHAQSLVCPFVQQAPLEAEVERGDLVDDQVGILGVGRARPAPVVRNGGIFAPNYIENKVKFFPHIKEAVAFGDGRDMVCAFVNIDIGSVGNWAERRGLAYSGYTDLAAKPEVYELIRECVEQVNAEFAADPAVADSQIHRFLVLHKELDPDDDELTRTRKVRRGFVAEKYAVLIDALYSGKAVQHIATQVKFEDGRTGKISANVKVCDARVYTPVKAAA